MAIYTAKSNPAPWTDDWLCWLLTLGPTVYQFAPHSIRVGILITSPLMGNLRISSSPTKALRACKYRGTRLPPYPGAGTNSPIQDMTLKYNTRTGRSTQIMSQDWRCSHGSPGRCWTIIVLLALSRAPEACTVPPHKHYLLRSKAQRNGFE